MGYSQPKETTREMVPGKVNSHLMVLAHTKEEESLSFHTQFPEMIYLSHEISVG